MTTVTNEVTARTMNAARDAGPRPVAEPVDSTERETESIPTALKRNERLPTKC